MDVITNINWALIGPLVVLQFILLIIALIDWSKAKKYNGPKMMWLFIILLINFIGPIAYLIIGRKK